MPKLFALAYAVCGFLLFRPIQQHQSKPQFKVESTQPEKALRTALAGPTGEYANVALHAKIIERFGKVMPFVSVLKSEIEQRTTLQSVCSKYGVRYSTNPYLGRQLPRGKTLHEAAVAALELSKLNIAMYDKLLPDVAQYSDISKVFRALQKDERDSVLPLLEAAARNVSSLPKT